MKNSKVINVQGCTLMTRHPCRQGRRADKATTSFHEVISCSTETCHLLRLESMTYLCRNRRAIVALVDERIPKMPW